VRNWERNVENYSYSLITGSFNKLFKYNYNYILITGSFWLFLSSYINILYDKLLLPGIKLRGLYHKSAQLEYLNNYLYWRRGVCW